MVDKMIGRVLAALDKVLMANDTLVLFTSDNGPTWYDRDVLRLVHDSAGGWRGMKADAWEAGHRVPFVVRYPGRVEPGSVNDQMICFTDVLSTVAAIVGANLPSESARDSVDFSPVLFVQQPDNGLIRATLLFTSGDGTLSIRIGPWKLIPALGSRVFSEPRHVTPGPEDPTG